MLDSQILSTLKEYSQRLTRPIQLKLFHGEHPKRSQLITLLEQVASVSDKIEFIYSKTDIPVREGLTFEILAENEKTGILFSGLPMGHEFNSFILAMLQAGGVPVKLDEGLIRQIAQIDEELRFETIISLDCHVCPDVVQTLNQIAILNPKVSNEMIDGGEHPKLLSERKVQGVPTVFLNKKPFSSGKLSATDILKKLIEDFDLKFKNQAEPQPVDDTLHDVVIVGGGPAAVSAAIYTARKGLDVVLIAEKLGGQVSETQGIENLISVNQTTGSELTRNLYHHLKDYPVRVRKELRVEALKHDEADNTHQIHLSTGETLTSKTVIIATGARWRQLGVPGEKEYIGKGVAYCPHCDGPFFKNKKVIVVGGGNSGVEAALDLSGIAQSVTVLEFMPTMKADQVLLDRMEATPNINAITHVQTQEILAENGKVNGVRIQHRDTQATETLKTDGIFIQIGLVPNSQFVKDLVATNPFGEILINDKCATNQEGIFACGDVTQVPYKQIIISMGEGAKAGLSAFDYLMRHSWKAFA